MPEIKSLNGILKQFPTKYAREVANTYVNHYKQNFKKGGSYKGNVFIPWKSRKSDKVFKFKRGKRKGKTRKKIGVRDGLLVETGRLKRSIKRQSYSRNHITITANTEYAERHNQGLDGMPKREFMNNNKKVQKEAANLVRRLIKRAIK